jgi:hypothetical protein
LESAATVEGSASFDSRAPPARSALRATSLAAPAPVQNGYKPSPFFLRLDSLIGRAMRPRSADYFRKIGSTANQREWTRIRKIVDRKKAGTFVPKGPRE